MHSLRCCKTIPISFFRSIHLRSLHCCNTTPLSFFQCISSWPILLYFKAQKCPILEKLLTNQTIWNAADAVVLSWLQNAMTPQVSDAQMYMKTAKMVWDSYKANYSKVGDVAKIVEIKMRVSKTKQGNYSVSVPILKQCVKFL